MPDLRVEEHFLIHSFSEQELRRWSRDNSSAGQL